MTINYQFDEDRLIPEIQEYVDRTYNEHYASNNRIQVTTFIAAHCDSPDFFRGNAMKYLARYGHKEGNNRKDLLKAIHYLIMLLSWHDRKHPPENVTCSNTVSISDIQIQNVYVDMGGGRIGQEQNGSVVFIGYGELNENGTLKSGTFRYSTER